MSTANEIRIQKNREEWRGRGWTATPNALLLRSDISWAAKGAFGWMSLAADDPEFEVDANSLTAAGPTGRNKARDVVRELEKHGYLTRNRIPGDGPTPVFVYDLHPSPVDDEHNTYVPSTAAPRKGAFSQRNPQRPDVQSFGDDQGNVDNSPDPESVPTETPEEPPGVFPAQSPKTGRAGTGRAGTGRAGVHAYSPRKTSSSLGSSTDALEVASQAEEEEGQEPKNQEPTPAQALLAAHARFKTGKYLSDEARATCEALVEQHLTAGWDADRLGRYVRDWSAQALNPSTWLPRQLRELEAPKTATGGAEIDEERLNDRAESHWRVDDQSQAHNGSQRSSDASEAKAAALAAVPKGKHGGVAAAQPRWKRQLDAARSGKSERGLASLNELLGRGGESPQ